MTENMPFECEFPKLETFTENMPYLYGKLFEICWKAVSVRDYEERLKMLEDAEKILRRAIDLNQMAAIDEDRWEDCMQLFKMLRPIDRNENSAFSYNNLFNVLNDALDVADAYLKEWIAYVKENIAEVADGNSK